MRTHYLIIAITCFIVAGLLVLCMGCVSPGPVCRHNVVGDALYVGEFFDIVEIAVDPTISKHAQVRYKVNGRWRWYCETYLDRTPEHFTPVFFFDVEEYIEWYMVNYHNK